MNHAVNVTVMSLTPEIQSAGALLEEEIGRLLKAVSDCAEEGAIALFIPIPARMVAQPTLGRDGDESHRPVLFRRPWSIDIGTGRLTGGTCAKHAEQAG